MQQLGRSKCFLIPAELAKFNQGAQCIPGYVSGAAEVHQQSLPSVVQKEENASRILLMLSWNSKSILGVKYSPSPIAEDKTAAEKFEKSHWIFDFPREDGYRTTSNGNIASSLSKTTVSCYVYTGLDVSAIKHFAVILNLYEFSCFYSLLQEHNSTILCWVSAELYDSIYPQNLNPLCKHFPGSFLRKHMKSWNKYVR